MIRNFKTFGLALVALLAMSAVAASAASADPAKAQFHSEAAHTTLSGTQVGTNTFTVNAGTTHCKTAKFAGTTTTATTKEVTVSLDYTNCNLTAFGGESLEATVDSTGCDYLLTASGSAHVGCEAGKALRVTAPFCTVTVTTPQTASKVSFVNTGAGTTREVDVVSEVTGLKYHQTAFCPGGTVNGTNGTYSGSVSVTGTNTEGKHVGVWWSTG